MPNDEMQLVSDDQWEDAAYIPLNDVLADAMDRSGPRPQKGPEHDPKEQVIEI